MSVTAACAFDSNPRVEEEPLVVATTFSRPATPLQPRVEVTPPSFGADVVVDERTPFRALVLLRASEPIRAELRVSGPGLPGRVLRSEEMGAALDVPILALRADTRYELQIAAISTLSGLRAEAETSFVTGPLPEGLPVPVLETSLGDEARGILLFGVQRATAEGQRIVYVGVDEEGEPVWLYDDPESAGRSVGFLGGVIEPVGSDRLLVALANEWRVIDAQGQTHASFPHQPEYDGAYHHHATLLPNGHLLALTWETRRVDVPDLGGEVDVRGEVVVEIAPGGALVSRIDLLDHIDPMRYPGRNSRQVVAGAYNWSHGNGLHYREADDSYLVSLRNQNLVVKVDRATNRVAWTFGEGGDFRLDEGTWFDAQHAAKWVGNGPVLTLFDNRSESGDGPSRAVAYRLDEELAVAVEERAWALPFLAPVQGDVDVLPDGRWLVTGAAAPPGGQFVWEVDVDGQVLWSLELGERAFRAERVPTLPLR